MKCKIGGHTVDLEIEGRVRSGVSRYARGVGSNGNESHAKRPGRLVASTRQGRAGFNSPLARSENDPASASPSLTFTLQGQLPSGKNSIKTTRTGKRYPTKRFEDWRDEAVASICEDLSSAWKRERLPRFRKPTELCIEIHYTAGDLRRRDIPGMMDALFHVLERAHVVEDDAQIKESHWYQEPLDRTASGVRVTLKEVEK